MFFYFHFFYQCAFLLNIFHLALTAETSAKSPFSHWPPIMAYQRNAGGRLLQHSTFALIIIIRMTPSRTFGLVHAAQRGGPRYLPVDLKVLNGSLIMRSFFSVACQCVIYYGQRGRFSMTRSFMTTFRIRVSRRIKQ
jgi:hypothetical protein